jgi:hypothetical protein
MKEFLRNTGFGKDRDWVLSHRLAAGRAGVG